MESQKKISTMLAGFAVLLLGLMSTANATLESRLGGLAYYDTQLDIIPGLPILTSLDLTPGMPSKPGIQFNDRRC